MGQKPSQKNNISPLEQNIKDLRGRYNQVKEDIERAVSETNILLFKVRLEEIGEEVGDLEAQLKRFKSAKGSQAEAIKTGIENAAQEIRDQVERVFGDFIESRSGSVE